MPGSQTSCTTADPGLPQARRSSWPAATTGTSDVRVLDGAWAGLARGRGSRAHHRHGAARARTTGPPARGGDPGGRAHRLVLDVPVLVDARALERLPRGETVEPVDLVAGRVSGPGQRPRRSPTLGARRSAYRPSSARRRDAAASVDRSRRTCAVPCSSGRHRGPRRAGAGAGRHRGGALPRRLVGLDHGPSRDRSSGAGSRALDLIAAAEHDLVPARHEPQPRSLPRLAGLGFAAPRAAFQPSPPPAFFPPRAARPTQAQACAPSAARPRGAPRPGRRLVTRSMASSPRESRAGTSGVVRTHRPGAAGARALQVVGGRPRASGDGGHDSRPANGRPRCRESRSCRGRRRVSSAAPSRNAPWVFVAERPATDARPRGARRPTRRTLQVDRCASTGERRPHHRGCRRPRHAITAAYRRGAERSTRRAGARRARGAANAMILSTGRPTALRDPTSRESPERHPGLDVSSGRRVLSVFSIPIGVGSTVNTEATARRRPIIDREHVLDLPSSARRRLRCRPRSR